MPCQELVLFSAMLCGRAAFPRSPAWPSGLRTAAQSLPLQADSWDWGSLCPLPQTQLSWGCSEKPQASLHQVAFKGVAPGTDPGPSTTSSEAGWPEGTPGIRAISGGVLNARVPCLLAGGAGLAPALITPGPACTAPTETSLPSCVLAAVTCHPFTLIPFWSQASAHQFWIRMGKRECGGAGEG